MIIARNPDTGKIELSDMRYVMSLESDDEKELAKMICGKAVKDGKRN